MKTIVCIALTILSLNVLLHAQSSGLPKGFSLDVNAIHYSDEGEPFVVTLAPGFLLGNHRNANQHEFQVVRLNYESDQNENGKQHQYQFEIHYEYKVYLLFQTLF